MASKDRLYERTKTLSSDVSSALYRETQIVLHSTRDTQAAKFYFNLLSFYP